MDEKTTLNYDEMELKFPALQSAPEKWRFLLNYATLSPSAHNSQPWIWRIEGESLRLYSDNDRLRHSTDPDCREAIISCGASLMHLRLALRHFGYTGEVTYLPDEREPSLLAEILFGQRQRPTIDEDMLFYAIPQRHTHRGTFEQRRLPESVLESLQQEASNAGVWLHLVESESDRAAP